MHEVMKQKGKETDQETVDIEIRQNCIKWKTNTRAADSFLFDDMKEEF